MSVLDELLASQGLTRSDILPKPDEAAAHAFAADLKATLDDSELTDAQKDRVIRLNLAIANGIPFDIATTDKALSEAAEKAYLLARGRELANEKIKAELNPPQDLIAWSDSDLRAQPDAEWWVADLIQKDTIAFLAGAPGLGKTICSLHLARAMASGLAFFGHSTKKAKTLYVIAEGAKSFKNRVDAWDQKFGTFTPVKDGQVKYLVGGVNLSVPESVDKLREYFRAGDYDLLVIDTYSQLSGVSDENNAAENAAVMNVGQLRDAEVFEALRQIANEDVRL